MRVGLVSGPSCSPTRYEHSVPPQCFCFFFFPRPSQWLPPPSPFFCWCLLQFNTISDWGSVLVGGIYESGQVLLGCWAGEGGEEEEKDAVVLVVVLCICVCVFEQDDTMALQRHSDTPATCERRPPWLVLLPPRSSSPTHAMLFGS